MSKTSGLKTSSSPVKNMASLMDVLDSTIVPDVDKYYVFVYKAKTPRIKYDCHPFVVVTGLFRCGFSAYNFHWEESRFYTWQEVKSNLYEVPDEDLNFVQSYPIARIKST